MEDKIKQLKAEISKQGELNISLFKSIRVETKEDPKNEKGEPILKEWREGSRKIKEMIKELNELESNFIKQNKKEECQNPKTFINGYGEATNREITTANYKSSQKKLSREMLSFMGNR